MADLNTWKAMDGNPDLIHKYNEFVTSKLANMEPINIACFMSSEQYVFDFLIYYFSIIESWTFYPFKIHVFTIDPKVVKILNGYKLKSVKTHFLSEFVKGDYNWSQEVALRLNIIKYSNIDKCILTDVDNIFLAETPEIYFLLDSFDYVFVGSPHSENILQPSIFGFRRSEAGVEFAEQWFKESFNRKYADATGLPLAIYKNRNNSKLKIKCLVLDKPPFQNHHICPYDIQANWRPFFLKKDLVGFKEAQMGRAKVLHFGGLRLEGHTSVAKRMLALARIFPESRVIFKYYSKLAFRAAKAMGWKTHFFEKVFIELVCKAPLTTMGVLCRIFKCLFTNKCLFKR